MAVRICSIATLGMCLWAFCSLTAVAQVKPGAKAAPPMVPPSLPFPANTGRPATFSFDSQEEREKLVDNLEAARSSSVHYLQRFAKGEVTDKKQAAWAAAFLATIRSDEEQTVLALCANIGKGIPTSDENWGIPHALTGRGAADALVKIGGSRAAETMIGRLGHDLTEYEHRTYAYVFSRMDKVPLTIRHLDLAIEREIKTPLFPSGPDKKYIERIQFVKDCLVNPAYLNDKNNWPSRRQ